MNYEVLFKCAPVIQINGDLVIPPTYKGDTNFIIPDQIVLFCMDQYDLTKQDVRVLDPMCGIGTIPRVINRHGGNCMGIELDEYRFKVALTVSDHKKLKQEDTNVCIVINEDGKFIGEISDNDLIKLFLKQVKFEPLVKQLNCLNFASKL